MRPADPPVKKLTKLTVQVAAICATLLLAACRQNGPAEEQANTPSAPSAGQTQALWAAGARDRLCVTTERAGLIVYADQGDSNCTVRGAVESAAGGYRIRPDGDQGCVIDARIDGASLVLGPLAQSCVYYCGPKASFAGKRLTQQSGASPAVDVAGDPLC